MRCDGMGKQIEEHWRSWQSWDLSQLGRLLDPFPIQSRTGKEGRLRGSGTASNPANRDPSTQHPEPRAQGQGQGTCRPTETSIWWSPFLFPVPMERPVVIAQGPGPQNTRRRKETEGRGRKQSTDDHDEPWDCGRMVKA